MSGGEMPFGKYKGWPLVEIPTDYLAWLYEESWVRMALRLKVGAELRRRMAEESEPVSMAPPAVEFQVADLKLFAELIERGFRAAARHYHPDVGEGSDPEIMIRFNRLAADLRRQIAERRGKVAA